jgi:hypothetical protein
VDRGASAGHQRLRQLHGVAYLAVTRGGAGRGTCGGRGAAGEGACRGGGAWCAGRGRGLVGGIPGGEIGARAGSGASVCGMWEEDARGACRMRGGRRACAAGITAPGERGRNIAGGGVVRFVDALLPPLRISRDTAPNHPQKHKVNISFNFLYLFSRVTLDSICRP